MNRNRNYQRIDRLIVDSFITLCKKEQTPNISVSMVCKEADINRTTFYNHYRDIWEIIEVIEGEIMKKVSELFVGFTFASFMKNPYPYLSKLNQIIEEKTDYYQKLFELSESKFFIDKLKEVFKKKLLGDDGFIKAYKTERNAKSAASFFIGGLANVYSDWLGKRIDISLEEMVDNMCASIQGYAKTLDL